jgi:dUTP pyrophosphatase
MSYKLYIKIDETASEVVKNYYSNFTSHHEGDSGIDLIVPNTLEVNSFQVGTVDHLISCQMEDKFGSPCSYYLYPRSSISKTDLMLANSVGIIDAGYRGFIMAKVRNMNPVNISKINAGDKLFQICAPDLKPIKIEIVNELSKTSRGDGGFGSTNYISASTNYISASTNYISESTNFK